MTFEEWWDEYSTDRDWPWRIRGVAHEAWHIATEAERERCAGLADFEAERAEQKAQECRPQGRTIDVWLGKAQSLWYLARTIREQEENDERD